MKITHKYLVEFGCNWLLTTDNNINFRSKYVLKEFSAQGQSEIPDILGLRSGGTIKIEVKVSRQDFKKDALKSGRDDSIKQLGEYRYYLCPKDLIQVEELPKNWGLLYYEDEKIIVVKKSCQFEENTKSLNFIYYSILRRNIKNGILNEKKTPQ